MLSNFMMTFYNLTDAFWLGKLGDKAKGAVSTAGIVFPIIFFLAAFGFGIVIAGTAMVARYKGAKEFDKIRKTVGQFVVIIIVFSIAFLAVGLGLTNQILTLLRVPSEIFDMVSGYLRIILIGVTFMFVFQFYQSISHGLGDTFTPMIIMVVSVSLNVVLDPLFIFGVGFIPRLETIGAAYATLIARVVGAIVAIFFLFRKSKVIIPSLSEIKPDWEHLKTILKLSIPASIGQAMTSFGFVFLQGFVNTYGTLVISTFSIGNRMTSLFMMPAVGISQALSAIVGQNLGAKNYKRAEQSVARAFALVMLVMGIGCTLVFLYGSELTRFFIDEPAVAEVGQRMFEITSMAAFIFGAMFVFIGVFNGAGQTTAGMIFNIVRLWGVRIPLVFILSGKILNAPIFADSFLRPFLEKMAVPLSRYPYDALWWSMLISNFVISLATYIFYKTGAWKHKKIE
ncbi:MATE family efflux transporter [bacterium]|nr:MATE family efflux transporter [bacterium]